MFGLRHQEQNPRGGYEDKIEKRHWDLTTGELTQ